MEVSSDAARGRLSGVIHALVFGVQAALPEGRALPESVWTQRHRWLLGVLWLQALAIVVVATVAGFGVLHGIGEGSLVAAAGLLGLAPGRSRKFRSTMVTLGLMSACAIGVHLAGGAIEMHFQFFVALGLIALYQDWFPLVAALGFVLLHHGVMGVFEPRAVYNHPDAWAHPWKWAGVHAAFVLAACAGNVATWRLNERAREHSELLLDSVGDGICGQDSRGNITFINPAGARLLGWDPDQLLGRGLHDVACVRLADGAELTGGECLLSSGLHQGTDGRQQQARFRRRDGSSFSVDFLSTPTYDRGRRTGVVTAFRDSTERRRIERRLQEQAAHDALTGLPNRTEFLRHLEAARVPAGSDCAALAVLFLDLDGFKVINDSLGHAVGDRLLLDVSARLRAALNGSGVLARFGGDEFLLLLVGGEQPRDAVQTAERLLTCVCEPFQIAGRTVFLTASIGIAAAETAESSADDLVRQADIAMYQAKAAGKGCAVVFEPRMSATAEARLSLETDLRLAIGQGELVLHYQPEVDLHSGRIVGAEALVRWQHPLHGLLPPAAFIPTAEETGLVVPIGSWVLAEACRQARRWLAEGIVPSEFRMSVNLSTRQLEQPDIVDVVERVLGETDLEPARLKLELTESALMQQAASAASRLAELRRLGVALAIDDFGTGYSSLSYLQRFPTSTLKVDRSFVQRMAEDAGSHAIVETIALLARALGMDITAEGVETAEQLARVQALGCARAQGYLFSKPVPSDDFLALLEQQALWQQLLAMRPAGGLQVVAAEHEPTAEDQWPSSRTA